MFIPVLVMIGILVVVTVLLIVADRYLVSYGDCKVTVTSESGAKEFVVSGGTTLLSAMIDNGLQVSAACGGRGSCGYCKVRVASGGGQLLPTEEALVSKEEEKEGTRLACQVKIKENIEIAIPDILTTVKAMARSGTFDTRLKWRFVRKDRPSLILAQQKPLKLDRQTRFQMEEVIEKYRDTAGPLIPVLQEISERFKYLPEFALKFVAKEMNTPLTNLYRIATFYNAFSLEPRGKYLVTICMGTACHVKGSPGILEMFEQNLHITAGQTTEDNLFTLEAVRCIGCCGLAPVLTVNEEVHGLMTKGKVPELIEKYRGMSSHGQDKH